MANITQPNNIPAGQRAHIKAVCQALGPQVPGIGYPMVDGQPKPDLTTAEVGAVFEAITRRFWRDQIQSFRANEAAEQARAAAVAAHEADPFAG